MSHFVDYVPEPVNKMDMDIDVDAILPDDMRTIFDHSEFMSSDFFDSVLSMEKDDYDGQSEYLLPPSVKSEDSCTHSPTHDPVLTDHSTTDESIKQDGIFDNITLFGKENSETIAGEEFLSLLKENTLQNNINDILGVSNNPSFIIRQAVNANPKKLTNQSLQSTKKQTVNNKKPQLLRIQSISGNGKPLLLPVNVNVKNVKKYRVINAADLKVNSIKVVPPSCQRKVEYPASTSSESNDGDIDVGVETSYNDVKYPPLQLTAEEKRLLLKEGISLPSHYPLSKHDEKELKRIRRKIRNKISAQDSRKRKKEYVDQLEEKARRTDEENEILKKRVKILNRENTRLYEQLKKLQDLLFSTSNKATPTTCLMIVLFSTLLVCLPNLRPADNKDLEIGDQELVAARRALLFNQKVKDDDDINLEDFLILKKEDSEVHFEEENKENETGAFIKYLGDLSKKYEKIIRSNCTEILQGGSLQEFCKKHEGDFKMAIQNLRSYINNQPKEEKKFIEPDISDDEGEPGGKRTITYLSDDDDPPIKKARLVTDYNENTVPILEVEIKPDKTSLPAKKQ